MDARTRKALEDSIDHWERMTADPKCGERPYVRWCALCDLFWRSAMHEDHCLGCPVSTKTGKAGCQNTPYSDARIEFEFVYGGHTYTPERRAAMQAEVDFLKSLRPEGE